MARSYKKPSSGGALAPDAAASSKSDPTKTSTKAGASLERENRADLLPQAEAPATSVLDALEACFGERARDVSIDSDDTRLAQLGAEAAVEDNTVLLPSALDLHAPDLEDLDTLGHEYAHALGTTSGEVDVDMEGDVAEQSANDAGAKFAAWVSGGMEGTAPQLSPARGGRGKVQRKHTGVDLTGSPMLSKGSKGRLVVLLQQHLNIHGAALAVDGDFGAKTHRAVRRFQARNGLFVDGVVGPKTAAALNNSGYREGGPQEEEPSVEAGQEEDAPMLSGRPELKKGDKGNKVRTLQDLLSRAGFAVTVDGEFGPKTDRAVRSYQRSRGLTVDGVVGPKTAAALSGNAPKVEQEQQGPGGGSLDPAERRSFDPGGRLNNSNMNPQVVGLTEKVCLSLQEKGYHPYVVSGFRSFNEQNDLYAQGRTKPGQKVTWVRGGGSWHNYGLAVDIAFWNSRGTGPSWSESNPWHLIGQEGRAAGFTRWGGEFGDRPHLEHHPGWGNSASSLSSTYHSQGLASVWKKVGL